MTAPITATNTTNGITSTAPAVVTVTPPAAPAAPVVDDKGFPDATPVAEMTDKEAAAYWKFHARKHESRVGQMADYDQLREKAVQYDALSEASRTDQERAIETARTEAKAAALQEAAPELVASAFDAAAARAGLTDEQVVALLEDLAVVNFLTADGKVDRAKVSAKVAAFAPATVVRPPVSLGQGRTSTEVKPSVASGRELYEQSRGKRKTA